MLLVDAAQGIEAQTLANLYLALGADLHIIPVLNKIDLPERATPEKYAAELAGTDRLRPRGRPPRLAPRPARASRRLLDKIVAQTPPPVGDADAPPAR